MIDNRFASVTLGEDQKIILTGNLDVVSAENVFQVGLRIIQEQDSYIIVDLAGIEKSDSAGLATLVAWRNYCTNHQKIITFVNLPPQILAMAKLCGLEEIIIG